MKLVNYLSIRLMLVSLLVAGLWTVAFYFAVIAEVNDETDDSLEDYAEMVMMRFLAGEELPSQSSSSNNQYFIRRVSPAYAAQRPHIHYSNRDVYIFNKREYEPARVIKYIFCDGSNVFYEVEVSLPTIENDDLKKMMIGWMMTFVAFIVLGIILVNRWALSHGLRSLRATMRWLADYKLGKGRTEPPADNGIAEMRQLRTVVGRWADAAEVSLEQQKLFVANASHELQTPIAVCRNRLELLIDEGTLSESQTDEVGKVLATLTSMSRLNRSLLMLCKIENGQYSDVEQVDLAQLCDHLLAGLQSVYASRNITVERNLQPLCISMSAVLAEVLLSNLLRNAFLHNHDGGTVNVELHRDAQGNASLVVLNSGADQPLDANKIFTRFYHTGGNKQSTGLGLAIVDAICREAGFVVRYAFRGGQHCFSVDFGALPQAATT